jgi:NRAMP (natural resistance-associated macrophage protein)-like metal ion transporter
MSARRGGRTRSFLSRLGPGVVTGAADDDPSGIGTYSQVGAQFGFAMLWTILFSLPLMCAVQEICGRIGRVTGKGLAANLLVYPRGLVGALIVLLLCANTINIGADLAAMGAAMHLIVPGPPLAWSLAFALLCVGLEVFVHYDRYARWLKWLCLSMFAYVAAALAVDVPWAQALKATALPHMTASGGYLLGLTAVLGTTISPYLFFWQTAQEVEEINAVREDKALREAPQQAPEQLARIRIDTFVGMAASALVAYFIILMCAATLHAKGVSHIGSAAQAAEALRPVAGRFAFVLFAAGLVGTGLLAVPVLAGSAAFGVAELAGWRAGLARPPHRARRFYGVIAVATLVGLGMTFFGLDPIKALFWSAVINAVAAVPILVLIMLVANKREVMGRFKLPRWLLAGGWLTCAIMALVAIGAFVSIGRG